jgi:chemotaxis protein methyltransferase CheR
VNLPKTYTGFAGGDLVRSNFAPGELERFRAAIVSRIGLQFDDAKFAFLGKVLQRRLVQHGRICAAYLDELEDDPARDELSALAQELTVCETYFFRHLDQFHALAEAALPQRMRAREHAKSLRLLSAGCASGEEAYSLAIVVRETVVDPSWDVIINAIDLNPAMLEKAALGHYSPWALREVPAEIRSKWFRGEGRHLALDDAVRGAVAFKLGNLASNDPALWQPALYDVIFCRNVLMYFAPDQMRAAIARIAGALAPGGYLFLGHAETLRGISDDFHLCHTHDTFYYRRKEQLGSDSGCAIHIKTAAKPDEIPASALPTAWVDTIRQASERVASLVAATKAVESPRQERAKGWELAPALDLLRHERFGEALDYVCSGPPAAERDPDVLLVKAMLLVHSRQLADAKTACQRLLEIDELNAGAHYVLALCYEHAGECEHAMEHDRIAAHLDPGFAMPRLHCGLMARRARDRDSARRELQQALVLLKREDVSRLLLFGGGFTRDGLIEICQSAVADCGGRS